MPADARAPFLDIEPMTIQHRVMLLAFGAAACTAEPTPGETDDVTQGVTCTEPQLPAVQPDPGVAAPMAKLNFLQGAWVGTATGRNPDGSSFTVTQTERIGPLLGGEVFLIEGRGFIDDHTTAFNALGAVSWNQATQKYEIHAWSRGRSGIFEFKLTDNGYVWEQPAGPSAITRFTATFEGGHWHQIGEYLSAGRPPVRTFEMDLTRTAGTEWPGAMAVSPSACGDK